MQVNLDDTVPSHAKTTETQTLWSSMQVQQQYRLFKIIHVRDFSFQGPQLEADKIDKTTTKIKD